MWLKSVSIRLQMDRLSEVKTHCERDNCRQSLFELYLLVAVNKN